jgi:hypothetical protein
VIAEALMLAALLHRPAPLVDAVYQYAGLDGVAVVEYESQFHDRAFRIERDADGWAIGTSWGLWQLFDRCHKQYREDLLFHIVTGAEFWAKCKAGRGIAEAYSVWNSGNPRSSLAKGKVVERKRDAMAMFLWRRLR